MRYDIIVTTPIHHEIIGYADTLENALKRMSEQRYYHEGIYNQLEIGDNVKRRICAVTEYRITTTTGTYTHASTFDKVMTVTDKKIIEKIIRIIPV